MCLFEERKQKKNSRKAIKIFVDKYKTHVLYTHIHMHTPHNVLQKNQQIYEISNNKCRKKGSI